MRIHQSLLRGPWHRIINYWWLPSLWKSGGHRHQMGGRRRRAKGLSLPSQKQCSNLAVMHFCLIDCFDAVFFPPFCFWGGTNAPHSPVLMRRTWWAFSFTQQEPSGGSLMARKATGDLRGLIGLHLCTGTTTFYFSSALISGIKSDVWKQYSVCKRTYVLCGVCVSSRWYVLCMWGCSEKGRPGIHKPRKGSPYLHN